MKTTDIIKKTVFTLLSVFFWIAVWQIAADKINSALILPSPYETLKSLTTLVREKEFLAICSNTLLRIFAGAFAGVVIGAILTFLSHFVLPIKYIVSPVISLIKATPVASFIILFLILMGKNSVPSTTSALITIPIVYANLLKGLESIDRNLVEVSKIYSIPFLKKCKALYIPSLEPYFISAIKSSIGLSWKAGIAAEVLCTPSLSIGLKIHETRVYLETPSLFAWTAVVVILSLIFEKATVFLISMKERKK